MSKVASSNNKNNKQT